VAAAAARSANAAKRMGEFLSMVQVEKSVRLTRKVSYMLVSAAGPECERAVVKEWLGGVVGRSTAW